MEDKFIGQLLYDSNFGNAFLKKPSHKHRAGSGRSRWFARVGRQSVHRPKTDLREDIPLAVAGGPDAGAGYVEIVARSQTGRRCR